MLGLLFVGLVFASANVRAEAPFVYSRCPRTSSPVAGLPNGDVVEMLPETGRMLGDWVAPCDLVFNDGSGHERVLFDCIGPSTAAKACTALDAAVSFDAKTIAFSVFRGSLTPFHADGRDYPGQSLTSTEAQLYLVDVATGTLTPLPHRAGDYDFGPAWLANGRLAFTSTRSGAHRTAVTCTNTNGPAPQIFTMDVDGRNAELASHHALGGELHPYPLVDGRLVYSSWQVFGALPFRHANSPGSCGTLQNFFHLFVQNPDGAVPFALYGQHLSDPTLVSGGEYENHLATHMAAHFVTQTTDGRVWTGEYYRANNLGLGNIVGFPLPAPGQEGLGYEVAPTRSVFRPKDQVRLAAWSSQSDSEAGPMPAPLPLLPGYSDPIHRAGKLGHPAALPGNGLMMTWGIGDCSTATGKTTVDTATSYFSSYGDNPYCDTGIYRYPGPLPSTNVPLGHPNQLVALVNRKEFHEFMARAVVPYADIMGVPAPAVVPTVESAPPGDRVLEHGTPFAVLGAASLIHRETHFVDQATQRFNEPSGNFTLQGSDTGVYRDDDICGVRILGVLPTRSGEAQRHAYAPTGERVLIVGEFAVRKPGAPKDQLGDADTSFRVRLPGNFPYLMQTIDCNGLTLNTDQTWQHVRPAEVKTCNGCHVHSDSATNLPFESTEAFKDTTPTHRLGEGTVPLLTGGSGDAVAVKTVASFGYRLEFARDVWPIFQSRCVSCHQGPDAKGGLRLDQPRAEQLTGEYPSDPSTYRCLAEDSTQGCVGSGGTRGPTGSYPALNKPWLSKWVHLLSARQSLLYWKAANRRADGLTDDSRADDIDFGPSHPTSITADELGILSRWLDTGAGWGPEFDTDTIRPTLHLVGVTDGGTVNGLRVGTADVGDGIAPNSLKVCVRPQGQACTPLAPPPAATSGVVEVALTAPLSALDTEVEAEVADTAGNVTRETKTVGWLLRMPPPKPVHPEQFDAGVMFDAGTRLDAGTTPPVDAGSSSGPDAGTPPTTGDGGTPPITDAGSAGADAGSMNDVSGRCGCQNAPGDLLVGAWLAALVAHRRRGLWRR